MSCCLSISLITKYHFSSYIFNVLSGFRLWLGLRYSWKLFSSALNNNKSIFWGLRCQKLYSFSIFLIPINSYYYFVFLYNEILWRKFCFCARPSYDWIGAEKFDPTLDQTDNRIHLLLIFKLSAYKSNVRSFAFTWQLFMIWIWFNVKQSK